ncbi:MAG: hypothetical protein CMJ63_01195 [Planctomycetaceae bacterium]|nr:hypothetical protein [Planctomycetaceae bacterium]
MIRPVRILLMLAFLAVGTQLGGCNIAQAVETLTRPDPVQEAKYELPNRSTVIMFDDYYSIVTPVRVRRDIAEEATVVLMEYADMTDMISPLDAIRMAHKMDKSVERVAIHEVGRALGVEQVIYVEPAAFTIPPIVGTAEPMAAFRVKVIDAQTGKRVFPADDDGGAAGWPVQVSLSREEASRIASEGPNAIRQELATKSGDAIARLFFDTGYSQHGNRLLGL